MKKLLIIGGAVAGAALLARRAAAHVREFDFAQMIERMPENSPPKWMFRNISAIRKNTERTRRNTERILQLLEAEHASAESEPQTQT